MKKTYNVISRNSLKLSVMFFFTLFFLGMSSSASAQLATSAAGGSQMADVDYSITQKASIGVTDELALEILENELVEARTEGTRDDLTAQQEAEYSARMTFLYSTINAYNDQGVELRSALVIGHHAYATQVGRFNDNVKQLLDTDGIIREYVNRLK